MHKCHTKGEIVRKNRSIIGKIVLFIVALLTGFIVGGTTVAGIAAKIKRKRRKWAHVNRERWY